MRERRTEQRSERPAAPPHLGIVDRIFREEGYGFVLTDGGEQVYFHRNAVRGALDFDRLAEGDRVGLNLEAGDEGPPGHRGYSRLPPMPWPPGAGHGHRHRETLRSLAACAGAREAHAGERNRYVGPLRAIFITFVVLGHRRGPLAGRRILRRREAERSRYYETANGSGRLPAAGPGAQVE
jgi:cold shock CspA family protein